MTNETYNRAQEIQTQIDKFEDLCFIANQPYKKFFVKTTIFGMSTYDGSEVCLCDDGLTAVIREYCSKRLQELKDELAAL